MGQHDAGHQLPERRRAARSVSWIVLAVVVVIGSIATGVAWVQERRTADTRERAALVAATSGVEDAAGTAAAALGGGAALVDDAGRIATGRLTTFAEDVATVSSLQAVGVIEVVPEASRAELESQLGRSVFRLTEDGVAPASDGSEHWVVTRVVPGDHPTALLVGFDVLSNPLSREAALGAAATGSAMVTPPVVLPADLAAELGAGDDELTMLFVLKPLYAPTVAAGGPSAEPELRGFLVSVVTGPELGGSLAAALPEDVTVRLTDDGTVLSGPQAPLQGVDRDLEVLGRTWSVEVEDLRPVSHSFSLLVGAVTLALIGVLVLVVTRERRRQDHLRRVDASVRGTAALARRLSAATGVPDVVRAMEADIPPLVGAVHAAVLVVDRPSSSLVPHPDADPSLHGIALHTAPWALDAEPVREAARGDVVLVRSLQRSPHGLPEATAATLRSEGIRSLALLPIATVGTVIDTVVVVAWGAAAPDDALTVSTLATVNEIGEQAMSRAGTTDRSTHQAGALASLAEELARCDTVEQVSEAVLRSGRHPVEASAISMGLVDRAAGRLRVHHGDTVADGISERYAAPELTEDLAFTEAARTGRAVLIETFAEYRHRYPSTDAANALMGAGARAALPLAVGDEQIGAIAIAWDHDRAFDEATLFSLSTIAELAAQAVHRARLVALHRIDADRSRQLAGVAQQLAVLQDGPQLSRFVVDRAIGVTGADVAALVVNDAVGWRTTTSAALDLHAALVDVLLGDGVGRPGAIATGDATTGVGDGAAADAGIQTSATLALRDRDGQPLGALWLGWRGHVRLDEDLSDVVNTVVGMTAQSVARCLLTDQLRADAERNERLATFARRLANVGDVAQLCRAVVEDGGSTVGAAVANVGLVDDSGDRLVVNPNEFFDPSLRERFADRRMTDPLPGVDAILRGEPVLLRTPQEAQERYPGRVADAMVEHGLVSSAHLPLLNAEGEAIGCIGFAWTYPQPFRPTKLARLRTIAELCTQTLERARLADAEHRLVDSIHRRVVGRTPVVQQLAVATRYLPATEEIGMGGDWYDAVVLDEHRYAVIVGDVTGHGISAVADMIELRAAIRALLLNGVAAEDVFSQVSRSWSESTESSLATACISVIDTAQGTLHHVSAGHIPALVRTPEGEVHQLLGGRQPLLGVPGRVGAPDVVPFPAGSVVVMCSDGLIERRDRSIDESIEVLAQVLSGAATDPDTSDTTDVEALAERVLERCLTRAVHEDDVALVVVGRMALDSTVLEGAGVGDDPAIGSAALAATVHEQTFPATTESIGAARRFVATATGEHHEHLSLVTSELVTNAVLHGEGPVTVRVERSDDGLRLAVHDRGAGTPRPERPESHAPSGRGLRIVETVATRWGTDPDESGKWVWALLNGR